MCEQNKLNDIFTCNFQTFVLLVYYKQTFLMNQLFIVKRSVHFFKNTNNPLRYFCSDYNFYCPLDM